MLLTSLTRALAVLILVLVFPSLHADGHIDELYQSLSAATTPEEARDIERQIWAIWHEPGDEDLKSLYRQGQALARSGRLGEAKNAFSELIDKAPQFAEGWNQRATVLYFLQEYDASLADIGHTLGLEPRHYGAIFGRALIMNALGQYQEALLALEAVERINPHAKGIARLRSQIETRMQPEGA